MGDAEYLAAFRSLVLPIAEQFDPDFVLVSAGFDAARGHEHPIGGYTVSPACFAYLTHQLCGLASGRVALVLEGGYSLEVLCECVEQCCRALLGLEIEKISYEAGGVPTYSIAVSFITTAVGWPAARSLTKLRINSMVTRSADRSWRGGRWRRRWRLCRPRWPCRRSTGAAAWAGRRTDWPSPTGSAGAGSGRARRTRSAVTWPGSPSTSRPSALDRIAKPLQSRLCRGKAGGWMNLWQQTSRPAHYRSYIHRKLAYLSDQYFTAFPQYWPKVQRGATCYILVVYITEVNIQKELF